MKAKNIFKSKVFKYGSVSVIFTAVVLALIVVFNVVFSFLASNNHWYADMTEEKLYTVSDTSKMLLDEVMSPDPESGKAVYEYKLSIVFLQEKDKIEEATSEEGKMLRQVHELALDYAGNYPEKIEIKYIDMYAHPGELMTYMKNGSTLTPNTVVFDNNAGLTMSVSYKSFFYYETGSSSPRAFYGEHRMTSAILSLCNKQFVAYVTTGHGEDELGASFKMLLEGCGYSLKEINLQELSIVDFEKAVREDRPRLVIVNNPKSEFVSIGGSALSETQKLSIILSGEYTDPNNKEFASLLVIADPEKGCANKNLNRLLNEWGLNFCSTGDYTVTEGTQNAFDSNGTSFFANYASDELTASLTKKLRTSENFKVAYNGAGVIEISDVGSSNLSVSNGAVLRTSGSARNDAGNGANAPVFAISMYEHVVDQAIYKYNYVVAISDEAVISEEYLNSASFANEALMINTLRMTTNDKERTPKIVLIDYKDYVEETNVTDVSVGGKQTFLVFMAAVLPVGILTAGIIVYVRRRNRV